MLGVAITITFGLWVIPAVITLVAFIWMLSEANEDNGGGFFSGLGTMLAFGMFLIVSFFVWAVYFAIMYFTK